MHERVPDSQPSRKPEAHAAAETAVRETLSQMEAANELELQWLRTRVRRLRHRSLPPTLPLMLPSADLMVRPRRAA